MNEHARLNEFDKEEWRLVARRLRPDWTDEQFEQAWAEFAAEKAERERPEGPALSGVPTTDSALRGACGFFLGHAQRQDRDGMHHWSWRIARIVIARAMRR